MSKTNTLHPHTADLVARFSRALAEKLAAAEAKYGYSNNWASPDWLGECKSKLRDHIAKGDPRDVAAYCAFLWHHGDVTTFEWERPGADYYQLEHARKARAAQAVSVSDATINDLAWQYKLYPEASSPRADDVHAFARAVLALCASKPEAPASQLEKRTALINLIERHGTQRAHSVYKNWSPAHRASWLKQASETLNGPIKQAIDALSAPAEAPANAQNRAEIEHVSADVSQVGVHCGYCDGSGDVHSIDGEWRGICTCEAGVEIRIRGAVNEALCSILPGPYYMDPPDGGDVTPLEQCKRMAEDAAKFRALAAPAQGDADLLDWLESLTRINDPGLVQDNLEAPRAAKFTVMPAWNQNGVVHASLRDSIRAARQSKGGA